MNYSKFERYDDYKDSGTEWLGSVPSRWAIKKFSYCGKIANGQVDPRLDKFKCMTLVAPNHIESGTGRILHRETAEEQGAESGKYLFRFGDVIYSKIRPELCKAWLSDQEGLCSADMYPITTIKGMTSKYLLYFMISHGFTDFATNESLRVAMPKINRQSLSQCSFLMPPIEEQTAIATYLDIKTTQIDRKIDMLSQKAIQYGKLKQSLINETVTHGLDKSVDMKDSGTDWIDDVPTHWKVTAITNIANTVSIKNHPKEELLSVYRDYGVIIKSTREDNHNKAGADLSGYKLVEQGYLVINKMKAWQGSLGISEFRGIVSPAYITCKTDRKIVERSYLHHLLRCRNYINEYNRLSYGVRVDQWDMRYDDFKYVPVLLPPLEEQKQIAEYLDTKTAQIGRIVGTINTQIAKLKELRKTLVNDVVTGKIKVV